jgi:6-pyruvoyltetrahydropterin/6-carboxytetrahydropterin synthase
VNEKNNMSYEVTQRFFFDAAHTLEREIETASSRRVHGHTYHAEVAVRGEPDAKTGMVIDLGVVRTHIARLRETLDHHLLNEVDGLGKPTLENLCRYIAESLANDGLKLNRVRVWRDAMGDGCNLTL